jgi:hypothetical protein
MLGTAFQCANDVMRKIKAHSKDCRFLKYIFPEINDDAVDLSHLSFFGESVEQNDKLLDGVLVEEMYQNSWEELAIEIMVSDQCVMLICQCSLLHNENDIC